MNAKKQANIKHEQPEISEGRKQKKIEGMLAKAENYWNKLVPEQKELLNTNHTVDLYFLKEHEYLEKINNPDRGLGLSDLLSSSSSFKPGKVFVSAADPNALSWVYTFSERHRIKLGDLYAKITGIVEKTRSEIAGLSTLNNESNMKSLQSNINFEDEDGVTVHKDTNLYEGLDALEKLENTGMYDDELTDDPDRLFLIVHDDEYLFIKFQSAKSAYNWISAFKLLLKAQNLSYRGAKDEYTGKKREWIKEFSKEKEMRLEDRDRKYLVWMLDTENTSLIYREIKLIYFTRNTELNYFIIIDMRNNFKDIIKKILISISEELYITQQLIVSYLCYFEVDYFVLFFTKQFDIMRNPKEISFIREKPEKDGLEKYYNESSPDFWDIRRRIKNRYKKMDAEKHILLLNTVKSEFEESSYSLVKVFKALQLQKLDFKIELIQDSKIFTRKRGKRGGKRATKRENYEQAKREKAVIKTTHSVLKLLMFEESRPELIPENLRMKINTETKEREGCCVSW